MPEPRSLVRDLLRHQLREAHDLEARTLSLLRASSAFTTEEAQAVVRDAQKLTEEQLQRLRELAGQQGAAVEDDPAISSTPLPRSSVELAVELWSSAQRQREAYSIARAAAHALDAERAESLLRLAVEEEQGFEKRWARLAAGELNLAVASAPADATVPPPPVVR